MKILVPRRTIPQFLKRFHAEHVLKNEVVYIRIHNQYDLTAYKIVAVPFLPSWL